MPKSIHRPEYDALLTLLRQLREDAGITQTVLSDALDRSQSFVSDVENGARRLDVLELRDMCAALGTDYLTFLKSFESRLARGTRTTRTRGRAR